MISSPRIGFDNLVACPSCDALHNRVALNEGELSRCNRCRVVLQTRKHRTIDRSLAAVVAIIVLMTLALCTPFLGLSRAGIETRISILQSTLELWRSDFPVLGLSALIFLIWLPLIRYLLLGFVMVSIRFQAGSAKLARPAFRGAIALGPWAMAEIFMVGVAVSLVKVGSIARLDIGLAFWSLLGVVAVSLFLESALCKDTIWDELADR